MFVYKKVCLPDFDVDNLNFYLVSGVGEITKRNWKIFLCFRTHSSNHIL